MTGPSLRPTRRAGAPTDRVPTLAAVLLVLAAVGLAACGGGSDDAGDGDAGLASDPSAGGPRTIEIEMTDNEFSPDRLEVEAGATVRLVFSNEGQVTHDAVIGDEAAQDEHEAEMRAAESSDGDTGGSHDSAADMDHGGEGDGGSDESALTLEPGETGELSYTFAEGDALLIGCHEPGHYEAGMTIAVEVATA